MSTPDLKAKLLKKYLDEPTKTKSHKHQIKKQNVNILDVDERKEAHSQISSSEDENAHYKKRRVYSDDEQEEEPEHVQQSGETKSKRLNKKIRKALGIKKDDQINQFINEIKVQGIELAQLQTYLKQHKDKNIQIDKKQSKKEKKEKKKKDKERERERERNRDRDQEGEMKTKKQPKLPGMYDSSSSDLQIPNQSRTIYRDKLGQIQTLTEKQLKKHHQDRVMMQISQWDKGIEKQDSQDQKDEQVLAAKNTFFDDPMQRWQDPIVKKPFQCKFQGYANRFNIKPGFRWDGVIRGNGFQNKYLQQINLKKLKQQTEHRQYMKHL